MIKRIPTGEKTSIEELRQGVDVGCLQALDSLSLNLCDSSQKKSILRCVREMGSLDVGTCSISAINGPPGTGKTQTILSLISTLMHHSKYGNVFSDAVPHNVLKKDDNLLRYPVNRRNALRFLICCSSNRAIDKVSRSL